MPWERPTLREIDSRIQSDLASALPGIGSLLRRSVLKVQGRVYAGAANGQYGAIQNYKDQLFILTADEEWLDKHGIQYGLLRNRGEKAKGFVIAAGTTGLIATKGSRLQSATGNIYIIDNNTTLSGGTAIIPITAENIGVDYNEDAGVELSFVSPIAGINSVTDVNGSAITGGMDAESVETYRQILLDRRRTAPHGGADFDYITWMKEYGVVTRSWLIEHYQGIGTIGLAFVMDNDADTIIPSAAEMESVKNYIISHTDPNTNLETGCPVTAKAGLFMIPLLFKTINLTIKIYPNSADVQINVRERLVDLIRTYGGPQKIVALSQLNEAVSAATGEIMHKIITPTDDIVAAINEVHLIGDLTFMDYES